MNEIITAKELGQMLIECGDIPVKLRTIIDKEFCCITLARKDAVSLSFHSASGSEYGDIPCVARLDIVIHDNA